MQNFSDKRNIWFTGQVRALEQKGIAQSEIAQKLEVKPQYLNAVVHGRRNASEKFINKFCLVFEINQNGLFQEIHENDLEKTIPIKKEEVTILNSIPTVDQSQMIPLVSIAAVAGFGNSEFAIQKSDVKDYYVVPKFKDRRIDFMIEVSGSSMYPKYNSGDVVACTILRESQFIQWNKVHLIGTREQGILIKRIKKAQDEKHFLLISDNKDYDPFVISEDEITGMALVVGVIRIE